MLKFIHTNLRYTKGKIEELKIHLLVEIILHSIIILSLQYMNIQFRLMGPWYSGTQCGMRILRPEFKSQRVP